MQVGWFDDKNARGKTDVVWTCSEQILWVYWEMDHEDRAARIEETRAFFFFSRHYTTPAQSLAQDLDRALISSRSSWVQGCGRMGQTSRCFIVCSSQHSHVVCPSSLNPQFCKRDLHRPVPVRRRFRLDQVGHASLEPGGRIPWD